MDIWFLAFALFCLIVLTWGGCKKITEKFENLEGVANMDYRSGTLGGTNASTKGAWIDAASFSLNAANQEIDVTLEVYGDARQTFVVSVSNDSTKAAPVNFFQKNLFGPDVVEFTSGTLIQSGSGLTTNYKLYLSMAADECQNIPISWILKGANPTDVFAITNRDMTTPPDGGINPQIVDDTISTQSKLDSLSKSLTDLQNSINALDTSAINNKQFSS